MEVPVRLWRLRVRPRLPAAQPHAGRNPGASGWVRASRAFRSAPDQTKKIAAELERELFLDGYYKAFGMGAGPCMLCEACAFDEGCRYPNQARPAMEACGIDVFATARKHGFTLEVARTRRDPQHYFGIVLVE